MALKALLLRKRIDEKKRSLEELKTRAKELEAHEVELTRAIEEVATPEEQTAVESEVTIHETAGEENTTQQQTLEEEIIQAEKEMEELERSAPHTPQKREENTTMTVRTKFFGMTHQERDAFVAQSAVKDFLQRTRDMGKQTRGVSGTELLIPEVVLDLVKEQMLKYSKLAAKVNVKKVTGKARQTIMSTIPEAVWVETTAAINELTLSFNQLEVDGYKVAGYFSVPNATLEDSDIALASELISALGQSIGYALDKAILYGTAKKMPMGIVTRLAQTTEPADYPAKARAWAKLSVSNIKNITAANSEGVKLFQNIVQCSGVARGRYSSGEKFWAMNEMTYTTLMAQSLAVNAAGAIVSGQNMTMPVVGGEIIILDFVPDDNIVGGYGGLYILAERHGTTVEQSEHVKFLEDQTVFKSVARYDGAPAIAEAFVVIAINGKTATTSLTFAVDTANTTPAEA